MINQGSQVGTLPPCWDLDLGTRVKPTLTIGFHAKDTKNTKSHGPNFKLILVMSQLNFQPTHKIL